MFFLNIGSNQVERFNIEKENDFFYYNAGEIFEPELNIFKVYERVKKKKIEDFIGEYSLLFEDKENIYIISDELGTIKWFYFYDGKRFMISNNIWLIAKKYDLGIEKIDKSFFYENLLLNYALNNKTFFKKIKIVPRGSLLVFNKKNKTLFVEKVKYIDYKENINLSKKDWFNLIDKSFNKTINKIKEYNKNIFLGLSISGGLDSRFSLLYTNKIERIGFLIGLQKKFIKPLDFLSANKLANMFKIKLKLIDPFKNISIKEKVILDLSRNPVGPSNILKVINKKKSFKLEEQFNVLLTGSYGGLVGGRILNDDLINSSMNDLPMKMFYFYSSYKYLEQIKKGTAYIHLFKKGINSFFKVLNLNKSLQLNFEKIEKSFLNDDFLVPKNYRFQSFVSFKNFFKEEKNNITNIMRFHLYRHSIRGSFESLHGQVKSYSIYYPYIYELSKKWPIEYLKGRKLIEEFLIWKNKEAADIQMQTFNIPLLKEKTQINVFIKVFNKIFYFTNFIIRGMVINYNKWWNKKEIKNFVNDVLNMKVKSFDEIFCKRDIQKVFKYKRYTLIHENLIKIKLILFYIENKRYDELIDINFEESNKY